MPENKPKRRLPLLPKPIKVTDPNDPRLKAYNDSLEYSNYTRKALNLLENSFGTKMPINTTPTFYKNDYSRKDILNLYENQANKPLGFQGYQFGISDESYADFNRVAGKLGNKPYQARITATQYLGADKDRISDDPTGVIVPIYKKPVQPYELTKPTPTGPTVSNRVETRQTPKPKIDKSLPSTYEDSLKLYNKGIADIKLGKGYPYATEKERLKWGERDYQFYKKQLKNNPSYDMREGNTEGLALGLLKGKDIPTKDKIKPEYYLWGPESKALPIYKKPVGTPTPKKEEPQRAKAIIPTEYDKPPVDEIQGYYQNTMKKENYDPRVWKRMTNQYKYGGKICPPMFAQGGTTDASGAANYTSAIAPLTIGFNSSGNTNTRAQQQSNSITDGAMGVVGQMGPVGAVVGGAYNIISGVAEPQKAKNEKMNMNSRTGEYTLGEGYNTGTTIAGSFLDPLQAMTTRLSYKGGLTDFSGKKYKRYLEHEANKNRVDPRSVLNAQNMAIENQIFAKHGGHVRKYSSGDYVSSDMFSTFAQGSTTPGNVEHGELMVNPASGRILTEYKSKALPNHPKNGGMDPRGTVPLQEDQFIITKAKAPHYKKASKTVDRLWMDSIINTISREKMAKDTMAYNGMMKKYGSWIKKYGGGSFTGYDPMTPQPDPNFRFFNNPGTTELPGPAFANSYAPQGYADQLYYRSMNTPGQNTPTQEYITGSPTYPKGSGIQDDSASMPAGFYGDTGKSKTDWRGNAATAAMLAPAVYNIGRGLFGKPDKMNLDTGTTPANIMAPRLSDNQGKRNIREAMNYGKYNARQMGMGNAAPFLAYLSGQGMKAGADHSENLQNKQSALDFEAIIRNKAIEQGNAGIRRENLLFNKQSKTAKENFLAQGMSDLGAVGGMYRQQNAWETQIYPHLLANYTRDNNGNWILKNKG
jgi:hypothetical protein